MNTFNTNKRILFLSIMFSGILLLSACGTTQQSNFYQFEESINPALSGVEKGAVIGIGLIQLPEYIDRPQIVTRKSAYLLNIAEFERWAEPLNESVTRLLVMNISNHLNSNRVYWLPRQDRNFPLEIRIVIDIGRFDGQLGKDVALESRWTIFDKKNKPLLTKVSLIKEKVQGESYEDLVIAMNQALKTLGAEISAASRLVLEKK